MGGDGARAEGGEREDEAPGADVPGRRDGEAGRLQRALESRGIEVPRVLGLLPRADVRPLLPRGRTRLRGAGPSGEGGFRGGLSSRPFSLISARAVGKDRVRAILRPCNDEALRDFPPPLELRNRRPRPGRLRGRRDPRQDRRGCPHAPARPPQPLRALPRRTSARATSGRRSATSARRTSPSSSSRPACVGSKAEMIEAFLAALDLPHEGPSLTADGPVAEPPETLLKKAVADLVVGARRARRGDLPQRLRRAARRVVAVARGAARHRREPRPRRPLGELRPGVRS